MVMDQTSIASEPPSLWKPGAHWHSSRIWKYDHGVIHHMWLLWSYDDLAVIISMMMIIIMTIKVTLSQTQKKCTQFAEIWTKVIWNFKLNFKSKAFLFLGHNPFCLLNTLITIILMLATLRCWSIWHFNFFWMNNKKLTFSNAASKRQFDIS